MAASPVIPIPGVNASITTGGQPVVAVDIGPEGGFITNPASVADQGIGGVTPESLYVDAVNDAQIGAWGTTFEIQPGQTWEVIPGQTTRTSVNGATTGHRFSVISLKAG